MKVKESIWSYKWMIKFWDWASCSLYWNSVWEFSEGRMPSVVKDMAHGISDFMNAYVEMREANTINSDKYFHAKANFIATSRGDGGEYIAIKISNAREVFDQRIKGDPRSASIEDQKANAYGRMQAKVFKSHHSQFLYRQALQKYIPNGLNPAY